MKAMITKVFTFDSAHQLIGHKGKCSYLHGHTYKLEVNLYDEVIQEACQSDEGFVIDFGELKDIVFQKVIAPMDHSFLAMGNEPVLEVLKESESKVCILGFRSTCENLASYICYLLKQSLHKQIYSVKLWETPTCSTEVFAKDISDTGPEYRLIGGCDCE